MEGVRDCTSKIIHILPWTETKKNLYISILSPTLFNYTVFKWPLCQVNREQVQLKENAQGDLISQQLNNLDSIQLAAEYFADKCVFLCLLSVLSTLEPSSLLPLSLCRSAQFTFDCSMHACCLWNHTGDTFKVQFRSHILWPKSLYRLNSQDDVWL